jgi:non-homologous end joining protein Ku
MTEVQIQNMHNLMPMSITYNVTEHGEDLIDQQTSIALIDMINEKIHWVTHGHDEGSIRDTVEEQVMEIILEKKGIAQTPQVPEEVIEKTRELRRGM